MLVMNDDVRLRSVIMVATFLLCGLLSNTNVQARDADIQDVCVDEYNNLASHYDNGEWKDVYRIAQKVRSCSRDGLLSRDRIEYTYAAEIHALREMGRHQDALDRAEDIVHNRRIVKRLDFLSLVLEKSALSANHLGKMEQSLHFFNLALYDSETRDVVAKMNLRLSLYLLQKRNREYDAAGETIKEIIEILEKHADSLPLEERLITNTTSRSFTIHV